jgi:hypothetical protein
VSEPKPYGPILRRVFVADLRVLPVDEERRRARRRRRVPSDFAIAHDLDRRLRALGYEAAGRN